MPQTQGFSLARPNIFEKIIDKYQRMEAKKKHKRYNSSGSGSIQSSNATDNQLAATFHGLSISNATPQVVPQSDPNFVGGFVLGGPSPSGQNSSSPPRPPLMPVPQLAVPEKQSLTMQFALDPNFSPHPEYAVLSDVPYAPQLPSRPNLSTPPPRPIATTGLSPLESPTKTNNALTPTRPSSSRRSSTSQPSTPSRTSSAGQVQCSGITKAGKRCTRHVKVVDPAPDDTEDEEEGILRFCHQHRDEVLKPKGYYSRKTGAWVLFEDWIPSYLQESTQASLRVEMEKSKSSRDKPGYIYTFEIRATDAAKTIKLKVGRAVNPVKRIDQWEKQCGSKEQVLRGFYPANPDEGETSLLKGRVQAGSEKTPCCHRLERLIHIELADLVSTCVYLQPGWPRTSSVPSTPTKAKVPGSGNGKSKSCPDCGSMHKEIFEFQRWENSKRKGKEWEQIVKPVIARWGKFVDLHV